MVWKLVRLAFVGALAVGWADPGEPQRLSAGAPSGSTAVMKARVHEALGNLPLYFIENQGQVDARVAYYVQDRGTTAYFTPEGVTLALTAPAARQRWAVKLDFVGARREARPRGQQATPAVVSYFKGPREQWKTGLGTYSSLVYADLWPGIDLVFAGTASRLKYAFLVQAGADPERIKLAYRGVKAVRLTDRGELDVSTPVGGFRDERPYAYQEVDGQRAEVAAAYALAPAAPAARQGYGFKLGPYDKARPLVIDPTLVYSTFLGGTGFDEGFGIAVDADGSAYVTGDTSSADFPTTAGAAEPTLGDGSDAFVTKLSATGDALVYSTYLGGTTFGASNRDIGQSIAVDALGCAYVTGETNSTDFPTTVGAFRTTAAGNGDAFVAKLDATGSVLAYSTYLGGNVADTGRGIAVDASGNAYVTGETGFTGTFPTTPGAFQTTIGGGNTDAFVTKLHATGSTLAYSTFLGRSGPDAGRSIAVDAEGSAYVTGFTGSTDFPTTAGAFQGTPGGGNGTDAFVTKLNANGSLLVFSTYLGGSGPGTPFLIVDEQAYGIAIDAAGSAYVTGVTNSTSFPTTEGAFQRTLGGTDAFVTKLSDSGSALVYSTYLGGTGQTDEGHGIAVDGAGSAWVTGWTRSALFPTTADAFQGALSSAGGCTDAFVTKLTSTGSGLLYSTYLGNGSPGVCSFTQGFGIAVDGASSAYVTGMTFAGFPTTPGVFQSSNGGSADGFIAKFTLSNQPPTATSGGPYSVDEGGTITLAGSGSDPEGQPLSFAWDLDHDGSFETSGQNPTFSAADGPSSQAVVLRVCDPQSACATDATVITITSVAPTATFAATSPIPEGSSSTVSLANPQDPSSADVAAGFRYSFACDGLDASLTSSHATAGTASSVACPFGDNGGFLVKGRILDEDDAFTTYQATVAVTNVSPTVGPISGPTSPVQADTNVLTGASFTDPGVLDSHTAVWSWGDGTASAGTVTESGGSGSVVGSHTYAAAGIYTVTLTVTDDDAGAGQAVFSFVVYNKIVFSSTRDGNAEIYAMNIDGSAPKRLTHHPAADVFPAWSPDLRKIAFTSKRDGNFEIYLMNADGTGLARLTTNMRVDRWPVWSPDGARIAFTSNRDRNFEIYTMNPDGTDLTRLTTNRAADIEPTWSPDGAQIAFTSRRDGNSEIYVMNADGSGQTQLTMNPAAERFAAWSPTGGKIAFASKRDGNFEIYSMNPDGTGQTRLTTNPARDLEPAWSADGARIAFATNRDGPLNFEIYVMNADGTGPTRLTSNPAIDTSPHW